MFTRRQRFLLTLFISLNGGHYEMVQAFLYGKQPNSTYLRFPLEEKRLNFFNLKIFLVHIRESKEKRIS